MSRAEVRALRVARLDGAEIAAELIGSAEQPVVLLVAGGEALARDIRGARLVTLPGVGTSCPRARGMR